VSSFERAMEDSGLVGAAALREARLLSLHWPHAYDISQYPSDHEDGDSPLVDTVPSKDPLELQATGFHVSTLADGHASHWLRVVLRVGRARHLPRPCLLQPVVQRLFSATRRPHGNILLRHLLRKSSRLRHPYSPLRHRGLDWRAEPSNPRRLQHCRPSSHPSGIHSHFHRRESNVLLDRVRRLRHGPSLTPTTVKRRTRRHPYWCSKWR
jgi:hypothetical protein